MAKKLEFGCKKCGNVLKLEYQPWTDRLDIKGKENIKIRDGYNGIEIQCKKCNRAVVMVEFIPVK